MTQGTHRGMGKGPAETPGLFILMRPASSLCEFVADQLDDRFHLSALLFDRGGEFGRRAAVGDLSDRGKAVGERRQRRNSAYVRRNTIAQLGREAAGAEEAGE